MTIAITPYLQFNGTARAAVEFYRSVLGGELDISTFAEGMGEEADAAIADNVMHASLYVSRGFHLMASDVPPGMPATGNGTLSLSSSGDDAAENAALRGYWDGLAEGGQVAVPLELAPWGDYFGLLTDRFGVTWMVNIAGDRG